MMPTLRCTFRNAGQHIAANLSAITLLVLAGCGGGGESAGSPAPPPPPGASNSPPTISGQAVAAVIAGQPYTFTPTASDPNGDTLTFSIRNRPAWANFNTSTGQLSGTPTGTQTGNYSNITIEVSDGQTSVGLSPFSIRVNAVASGFAMLSWTIPTQRVDGSQLANLAGFRVYYGDAPFTYTEMVTLNNAGLTSFLVENLAAGTWYFSVTAVDSAGVESPLSESAQKTIS
jgi:hypothetical protein